MCSHIVATAYSFAKENKLENVNKKAINKTQGNKETIEIILKEEKDKIKDYYLLELKVGRDQKVIVESIPNFLYKTKSR